MTANSQNRRPKPRLCYSDAAISGLSPRNVGDEGCSVRIEEKGAATGLAGTYSRPVRSWMRRRSPGGASVSSVRRGPEKTLSSSKASRSAVSSAARSRQAARFSGVQPQCAESGLPPQLPARGLPRAITPRANRPIKSAKQKMVASAVASMSQVIAPLTKNAIGLRNCMTFSRLDGDDCQKTCRPKCATEMSVAAVWSRCLRFLYVDVTTSTQPNTSTLPPSNRYGEVIPASRTLAAWLVWGRARTQNETRTRSEPSSGVKWECSNR